MGKVEKHIAYISGLNHHRKLEELCKAMFFQDQYKDIRTLKNGDDVFILDNVNYNNTIISDPLPIKDLISIFEINPAYGSVSGEVELGQIIREFEYRRAVEFTKIFKLQTNDQLKDIINKSCIFTTTGATGAIHTVLSAILLMSREKNNTRRDKIVYNTPSYCLADAFAHTYGLKSNSICGTQKDKFLAPLREITEACDELTLACVLVYPTNPALTSWGPDDIEDFRVLISHCQKNKIYLIVDTIFQDLIWNDRPIPEIYALTDSPNYICKIFSPSKDRPFACGYRIGYLMCDDILRPWAENIESLTNNSCNTISQLWLYFDIIFRSSMIYGEFNENSLKLINESYIFGYNAKKVNAKKVYDKILANGLYDNYLEKINLFYDYVDKNIRRIWNWCRNSRVFEVNEKPQYGNIIMIKLKDSTMYKRDLEFFFNVLRKLNIASLVGSCFGLKSDDGIWFRVVVGGSDTDTIINKLENIENMH